MMVPLSWPRDAVLAVCVVVDEATVSAADGLGKRLASMLCERGAMASWVGESEPLAGEGLWPIRPSRDSATALLLAQVAQTDGFPAHALVIDSAARPHWDLLEARLEIPLDPSCSDAMMLSPAWWTPDEWLQYVMDSFDCLHAEGALAPTFLGIRLSPQASGRPGALQALDQLLGYIQQREAVWLTSVGELARHCARFVSEADGSSARRQP